MELRRTKRLLKTGIVLLTVSLMLGIPVLAKDCSTWDIVCKAQNLFGSQSKLSVITEPSCDMGGGIFVPPTLNGNTSLGSGIGHGGSIDGTCDADYCELHITGHPGYCSWITNSPEYNPTIFTKGQTFGVVPGSDCYSYNAYYIKYDCPKSFCGNGVCDSGETEISCPTDCASKCTTNRDCMDKYGSCDYACSNGACVQLTRSLKIIQEPYPSCTIRQQTFDEQVNDWFHTLMCSWLKLPFDWC